MRNAFIEENNKRNKRILSDTVLEDYVDIIGIGTFQSCVMST